MLSFTDTTLAGELEHRQPLLGRGGKISPLLRSADISLSRNQCHLQCGRQNGRLSPCMAPQTSPREGGEREQLGALLRNFIR